MNAGSLNTRVTIQQNTPAQDDIGQPIASWATLATVWANVRHVSGMESIQGDADASSLKASVRIRLRRDVTNAMRVVIGSKTYEIRAVLPDEERLDYLDLSCEALNA